MQVADRAVLSGALAQDRKAARQLRAHLQAAGRGGHPAVDVLTLIEGASTAADEIAAIAFEAGVRVALGAQAGPAVYAAAPAAIQACLVSHPAEPWEPAEKQGWPHRLVDWRAAVAAAGRAAAAGGFAMPRVVPGAATVDALLTRSRAQTLETLLGPVERDEVLDPVATGGLFLAQVIPGFVDLDLELRQGREQAIAAAPPSG